MRRICYNLGMVKKSLYILIPTFIILLMLYALMPATLFSGRQEDTLTLQGVTFSGDLANGLFAGWGMVTFENGDTYEGALSDGRFTGHGVYTSTAGWRFEADFTQGKAEEGGVFSW